MSKKKIYITVALVLAVVLTVAFVFLWKGYLKGLQQEKEKEQLKTSDGCHVVDDKLYAHLYGDCYVFDEKTGSLTALTAVSVDGYQDDEDAFVGELKLMDYEHSEGGFLEGTPLVSKKGDFYTVLDKKTCRHNETDEDGNNQMVTHFTDYEFTYYFYPEKPEFLAVIIYEHLRDDYYIGILASSETEAKQGYQWFQENEP